MNDVAASAGYLDRANVTGVSSYCHTLKVNPEYLAFQLAQAKAQFIQEHPELVAQEIDKIIAEVRNAS